MTQETPIKRKYNAMMEDVKRISGKKADVDHEKLHEVLMKPWDELDSNGKKLYKNYYDWLLG